MLTLKSHSLTWMTLCRLHYPLYKCWQQWCERVAPINWSSSYTYIEGEGAVSLWEKLIDTDINTYDPLNTNVHAGSYGVADLAGA